MTRKTPEEIAAAIEARGEAASMASKFPTILDQEVRAGGEYRDSADFEATKAVVAEIMRKFRLAKRRRVS